MNIHAARVQKHDELCEKTAEIIDFYRGLILDAIEDDVTPDQWKRLRPRILKALGDRGLDGKMREAIDEYFEHAKGL
jgi:hypothetical protein